MTLEELLRQGKSFGQGASNAAASTVTGPVDMLAWLLRKGGVDVGEAPIGGEAWMRQKGLMATPENKLAGLLGEGAGLAAPIVAAAKAPEIAGGLLQMGRNLATPQTMNKQTGAIVYHGSPHKFDKFDSSKIGTGEGAQAYGHGLYLAENPIVAGEYAKNLSTGGKFVSVGGRDIKPLASSAKWTPEETAAANLIDAGGDFDRAIRRVSNQYEKPGPFITQLESLRKNGAKLTDPGSLYKVDLPDEHIAKMLDWDKPLSQQHPDVQKALQMIDGDTWHPKGGDYDANELGQSIYQRLTNQGRDAAITSGRNAQTTLGASQAKAAEDLRAFGIPGIRYLDGGSRSAGAGSSNFVVFPGNEGLLKILERNGGKP